MGVLPRTLKMVRQTTEYAVFLPWAREVPYSEPARVGDLATVVAMFQPVRATGKPMWVMRRDDPADEWLEVGTDRTVAQILQESR